MSDFFQEIEIESTSNQVMSVDQSANFPNTFWDFPDADGTNVNCISTISNNESDAATFSGRSGEEVYNIGCAACHTAGIAGAPMLANQSQWGGRLDKGLETLTNNAYNGYNAMPAKGLCMDCSKEEIERSVQYMLDSLTVN